MACFLGYTFSMRTLFFIALLWVGPATVLQAKSADTTGHYDILVKERSLRDIAPLMISADNDSLRHEAAWHLYRTLDTMLHMQGAWTYPFDSLRLSVVSILKPEDQKFRIFTFNQICLNGDFKQFGYLEVRQGKETEVIPLLDTAKKPAADYLESELETTNWYGALYYGLATFKYKKKKMYLLLGLDGATAHSNKKVMDVLWFDKDVPVFGKSVFLEGPEDTKPACRVVYEFHNESHMLLRYEPDRKIVVLDKLNPSFPEAVNDYYYYIPSGDYDFYAFNKKGYWVKGPLEDFNLGQGVRPEGPRERPRPEPEPQPNHQ